MAELATIARPYAEALFKAARGDLSAEVAALADVAKHEQLRQFADNPKVSRDQVYAVIADVVKTPLSPAAQNLLHAIIDNGRLAALPEIAAQYHALVNAQSGVSDAKVYSAFGGGAGEALRPQAQRDGRGRSRTDRWHSRRGRRRGARHLGEGPPATDEGRSDRLMAARPGEKSCN